MNLFENPFYVLGASPWHIRRKLASLEREKSLLGDADAVAAAYSVLTTPAKRLLAEIEWFPFVPPNQVDEIINYCASLKDGINAVEPDVPRQDASGRWWGIVDTSRLSKLNIKLYSFAYRKMSFAEEETAVLAISGLFNGIDAGKLKTGINKQRENAGYPPVDNDSEFEDCLRQYRDEIRQTVSSRLSELPQADYAKMVTLLAERYSDKTNRYGGQAVLEDICSDYELRMTPKIDGLKQQISSDISLVYSKVTSPSELQGATTKLISEIAAWDSLVQPMQLIARERGQKHLKSEELAREILVLAIKLNNRVGGEAATVSALRLMETLEQYFSELPEIMEIVGKNIGTIRANAKNFQSSFQTSQPYNVQTNVSYPKRPQKNKTKIIAVVLAAAALIAAVLIGITRNHGYDYPLNAAEEVLVTGRYDAVSCMVDGDAYSCEGEYIFLKNNGKGTVMFMGTEYSMKWSLRGDRFTFEDEEGDSFEGLYNDGVVAGNYAGMDYVFARR